jgi:glycine oxidase
MAEKSRSVDCVIVGGGLLGLLTALFLGREGLSVAVLEKGAVCRESSWAGGGIVSPLVPWQYPDAVSELVRWSQQYYPLLTAELLERTGIDPEWLQSGLLMADCSLDAEISAWSSRFRSRVLAVGTEELQELEPLLSPAVGVSLLLPDVAQLRNPRLCQALVAYLGMQGVTIHEGVAVSGLDVSQGDIRGVTTSTGTIAAGRVIIAGGAWSGQILAGYGPELPVSPVRGQMIQFQTPPGMLRHIVLRDGYYLVPRRDGLVLAGSTLEYVGFNKETTVAARELLAEQALELVPALSGSEIVRHWSGLRPGSPTGVPYICEHPEISGLYLNTGHFRNGVVMAPASAQLLADCLLGRDSFTAFEPYRLLPKAGPGTG